MRRFYSVTIIFFIALLGTVYTATAQTVEVKMGGAIWIPPGSSFIHNGDTISGTVEVKIIFTEDTASDELTSTDVTITGPVTSSDFKTYDATPDRFVHWGVTIRPNNDIQDKSVTISVAEDTVESKDGANNARLSLTLQIDTRPPTFTITPPTTPQKSEFAVTITASETITGFAASDLTFNPAASATAILTGSGTTWTATLTPADGIQGTVTISIPAGAVTDAADNQNTAVSQTVEIDTQPPSFTITPPTAVQQIEAFNIAITVSEPVTGFTLSDVTLSPANGATRSSLTEQDDSDTEFSLSITPRTFEGTVTISIPANAVKDAVDHQNAAASATVKIDNLAPRFTDSPPPDIPTTTQNSDFDITFTLTEPPIGLTKDDFTFNPAASATATLTGSGTTWTATITPAAGIQETVTISIHNLRDAVGNTHASFQLASVPIDTRPPSFTITVPDTPQNAPFDITITGKETITDFTASDFTFNPAASATATLTGSGTTWTATITPTADKQETLTISIPANAVRDAAGHWNTATVSTTVEIDTRPPSVEITGIPDAIQLQAFTLKIVFSEDVVGFDESDIDFAQSTAGVESHTLTPTPEDPQTYTLEISPHTDTEGEVIIQIPADVARDNGNNPNSASSSETVSVKPGWIPDDNLRAVIRETFGLRAGEPFSQDDMSGVSDFIAAYRQISDLSGLEHAEGLRVLDLEGNLISDLTPLSGLTELTTLTLTNNNIADITALEDLIYLTTLDLASNEIENLTPLTYFSDLTTLDLRENRVSDLSPLAGLIALRYLYLTSNQVSDVSPLQALPNLQTLRISENPLAETRALAGLAESIQADVEIPSLVADATLRNAIKTHLGIGVETQLTRLVLRELETLEINASAISDLTGLEHAEKLTALELTSNAISDLMPLEGLTALTTLNLSQNAISDLTPLEGLTALTTLNLSQNAISDLTPLEGLTVLEVLDLSDNEIADIYTLAGFRDLINLDLHKNPVANLTPLARLDGLETLHLQNCAVKNVDILSNLRQLRYLDLSGNAIEEITQPVYLRQLTHLNLSGNAIENIAALDALASLRILGLAGNQISDLTPLENLRQLKRLNANLNAVSDLSPLAELRELTLLGLAVNNILSIEPLRNLTQLSILDLQKNQITEVTALANLSELRRLDLSGNQISEIQAIQGLSELRYLRLAENPIVDTSPLYRLTQQTDALDIDITVDRYSPYDVNADGSVNADDVESVTAALGQTGKQIRDPRTDVNADGVVNLLDIQLVVNNRNADAAPASPKKVKKIPPKETRLFANYPNPFNPETWIPYQLATTADVRLSIFAQNGTLIRRLTFTDQPAGRYIEKNRAAYWDGRNAAGESVASGVYFCVLNANGFVATQKIIIRK